ncbi:MAG: murein biosynthesis integral membrane protein MurJ [Rickettsiales bacterium]|jgi:putative peptidoglycan lipid II flippase|nr:murein biosynthesis integral membrane protein MurJ [Rickettsiales bacterium]
MKLGKHIFNVGAMTGLSRIFGFARDMLIARFLGAGRLSDIFLAAFKLPNLFRDLLGEGALSSIFVPMFADQKKDKGFAENVFSWLALVLLGITLACEIFMPILIWMLAPGFADDPGKMELTVLISRIMFFYVIFVCLSAFMSAILNAFSKFALAAFMPALLNIMLIGALLLGGYHFSGAILYIMAATVVASGIIQTAVLWLRIRKKHFGLRLIVPKWTPKIKQMFQRLGVSIFGSGFYQITIIVGTLVASFQSGAVSWLYYSDRIVQLPFAMIGLAAGTVLLSSLSDAIADKNMRKVHIQQNSSIRHSLMLTLPAVAGLFVLARPIIKHLFEYGAWSPESTNAVAIAIMIQVFVLPAMTISQVYSKTLLAAQDVKTPVKTSIMSLAAATVLYLALFPIAGYLAIPIGVVASGYLKNHLLARTCKRRGLFRLEKRTVIASVAFGVLSALLGAGLLFVPISGILHLGIAIAGFAALYLPSAWIINKKVQGLK